MKTELCRQGIHFETKTSSTELLKSYFVIVCLAKLLTLGALQSTGKVVSKAMVSKNPEMTSHLWRRFAVTKLNRSEHHTAP